MKKYLLTLLVVISLHSYATVIYFAPPQTSINYWLIPVKFGCGDGDVYLRVGFSTSGETNNDYFEIRKSTDLDFENGYTTIGGYIDGCGTCFGRNYEVKDYGPFTPGVTCYYQVRATSNFGFEGIPQNLGSGGYAHALPVVYNWVNQVTSSVELASSPTTESSYHWGAETRTIQGVSISLSPTEIAKIFVEQGNFKLNFILDFNLVMSNIDVSVDNSSYFNLYSGTPVSSYKWNDAMNYMGSIGQHQFGVNFTDPISGTIYHREYKIYVVPKSDGLYKDNYCNTMRVWKSPGTGIKIPLLLSEGFDAYNTKSEQYYREAGKDLINCLLNKGFDIYVINYKFNSQSIRNNAAVFSSAIRYVSLINNNQPIVAAGMSMGGVINRYACAKAENDMNPLPISKFLTLDSPHQGAVISKSLQDWRKGITTGDGFSEAASNNDAGKEMLNYNAYDPTGAVHTAFYTDLNSLNGDGYPHLVPSIAVSFSTMNPNPNPIGTLWLSVHVTGVPGNNNQSFMISSEENGAGSFLPSVIMDPSPVSPNLEGEPIISTAYLGSFLVSTLRPFSDPTATLTQYASPSFIPHSSALDIVNGLSKFDIVIQTNTTGFHDIIPSDIIEPLLNALINENLALQNKTITDIKNYIASDKIEAGNNVTNTQPVGDFIINNASVVSMTAGNQVKLESGFFAQTGCDFIAQIDIIHCDGIESTQSRNGLSGISDNENTENHSSVISPSENKISETVLNRNTGLSSSKQNIAISPNPNNGVFKICVTKNEKAIGIKELKVYDLMGNAIWSSERSGNIVFNIDISKHSAGIYYVRSVNELGEVEMKKLIKQ